MRLTLARTVAILVAGAVLGSVASVAAQDQTPAPEPEAAEQGRMHGPRHRMGGPKHGPGPHGAIRSTTMLPGIDDGPVRTVRFDRGELTTVDGNSVTIREQDGVTVTVTASDETKIRRDGAEAQLSDLKAGDQVSIVRNKTGEEPYTVVGIRAMSAERVAEMEAQREACEQDRTQCKRGPRGHRMRPGAPQAETPPAVEQTVA